MWCGPSKVSNRGPVGQHQTECGMDQSGTAWTGAYEAAEQCCKQTQGLRVDIPPPAHIPFWMLVVCLNVCPHTCSLAGVSTCLRVSIYPLPPVLPACPFPCFCVVQRSLSLPCGACSAAHQPVGAAQPTAAVLALPLTQKTLPAV